MVFQKLKCECCGQTVNTSKTGPQSLCYSCSIYGCSIRDFIASLDERKLEAIREQIRLYNVIVGVKEAREQFKLSLHQAMLLADFLQRQEELSNQPIDEAQN